MFKGHKVQLLRKTCMALKKQQLGHNRSSWMLLIQRPGGFFSRKKDAHEFKLQHS
jgi:hypothetical protein